MTTPEDPMSPARGITNLILLTALAWLGLWALFNKDEVGTWHIAAFIILTGLYGAINLPEWFDWLDSIKKEDSHE